MKQKKTEKDLEKLFLNFEDNLDLLMRNKVFKDLNDYFCHPENDDYEN